MFFVMHFTDETYFRNFILWLEDQKVRHYKIEERGGLRNMTSCDWTKCLQQYLDDLGCPYQQSQRPQLTDWLPYNNQSNLISDI
jgi:RLL motif-containing protein 1